MISVILPTYNRLAYLPEAIASVFAQTFDDWELVIADDGSGEATKSYLSALEDPPRVRVIHLSHTGRPAVVRNAALRAAGGKYVAFMDSDDVWLPEKLSLQMASLRTRPDCEWSQTRFVLVNAADGDRRHMPAADGWILGRLLRTETVVALPSVLASRRLIDKVGGFDETLTLCEDYDLWLRLAAHSPVAAVDQPLTLVRRHGEHYGDSVAAFRDSIRVHNKVLRSGMAGEHEAFVRADRARNSASLARCYAASGFRVAALHALLGSARESWRHHGWWLEGVKAIAHASVPRRVEKQIRMRLGRGC